MKRKTVVYQPDLFRHRSAKKFTAEYGDTVEVRDSFADAHGRVRRLQRMGVKARLGVAEVEPVQEQPEPEEAMSLE